MAESARAKYFKRKSRLLDLFVIIICLLGFSVSLYLFQNDLFMSLRSLTAKPVGVVTSRNNTVQRRIADRMIWDRLFVESPVYNGDLIRIAKLSGAVLDISSNRIELGENTLIRIQVAEDGTPQIEFLSGEINISSDDDAGSIFLTIGDRTVETSAGTVLSAAISDEGAVLQLSEGNAVFINNNRSVAAAAPALILLDSEGKERPDPSAVVMEPRPNAHYLQTDSRPVPVNFSWHRVNLDTSDNLKLEISGDRNFSSIARTVNNVDSRATVPLNAGQWYWRLSHEDGVLSSGNMTVTESYGPSLLSPAMGRQIQYRIQRPEVFFRWTEASDAAAYNLQVSPTADFSNPRLSVQVQGTSYSNPTLNAGTWYWRVIPVYPASYHGSSISSNTANFSIVQNEALETVALGMPAADSYVNVGAERSDILFSWTGSKDAVSYTFMISRESNLSNPLIRETVRDNFYIYSKDDTRLTPGRYFWGVYYTEAGGSTSPLTQARAVLAVDREINQKLTFPPDNYSIEIGKLPDIRFTWQSNVKYDMRIQISSSPDFSRPAIDQIVSDESFRGIPIPVGNWYWRISARYDLLSPVYTSAARSFKVIPNPPPPARPQPAPVARSAPVPRPQPAPVARPAPVPRPQPAPAARPPAPQAQPQPQVREQPAQALLPAPVLQPPRGHRIGASVLREQRNIIFNWTAVEGANAYMLTIYKGAAADSQIVYKTEPLAELTHTLDNLGILQLNTAFTWQVEAVRRNPMGIIEQRGRPGESTFILDAKEPNRARPEDTGVLYGF
jgi:hypothetical protein